MPTVKNNRLSLSTISVLTSTVLLGVATNAAATIGGEPATAFTAAVTVVSNSVCTLTVSPPSNTSFAATFTANTQAIPPTSNIALTSAPAPRYIMVQAVGGASCGVNGIVTKLTTSNPYATLYANSPVNTVGGIWQFRPEIVDYRVYAEAAVDATGPTDTKICTGGGHCFGDTSSSIAGSLPTVPVGGGAQSLTMTDRYQDSDKLPAPFGTPFFLGTANSNISYKTAAIGIGGYLATNPMNSTTNLPDLTAASNGDVSNIAFTVTISQA